MEMCQSYTKQPVERQVTLYVLMREFGPRCKKTQEGILGAKFIRLRFDRAYRGLSLPKDSISPDLSPLMEFAHIEYLTLETFKEISIEDINKFTNLKTLELKYSPMSSLEGLNLPKLKRLSLWRIPIKDASFLRQLTTIRSIDMFNAHIVDLQPFSSLVDLKTLSIIRTKAPEFPSITNIEPLSALLYLQELFLKNQDITSITPLMSMGNLKRLDLSGNEQLTNIDAIRFLENLEIFNFRCFKMIDEKRRVKCERNIWSDLTPFKSLYWLKELRMSDVKYIDLSPFAKVTRLEILDISYGKVKSLAPISNVHSLKSFYCQHCELDNVQPLGSLVNLKQLGLSNNRITDISTLYTLQNLSSISFSNNQVQDIHVISLFQKLRLFVANQNQIKDVSPLAKLPLLHEIRLHDNLVEDLRPLRNSTRLKRLWLDRNPVQSNKGSVECPSNATSKIVARFCEK